MNIRTIAEAIVIDTKTPDIRISFICHGKLISEIVKDDVRIRKPSDYGKKAKSEITIGITMLQELIEGSW